MERRKFLLATVGSLWSLREMLAQTTATFGTVVPWLSPQSGPFLICVGSFRGEQARELAQQFAHFVQQHYRLRTYLFSRSEEERRRQEQELQRLRELYGANQRFRRVRIEDEYAVLVGDFRSWDDARRELERIKKLPPPEGIPLPVLFIVRQERGNVPGAPPDKVTGEYAKYNPFRYAFVVPNPLAPKPAPAQPKNWDPAWADLNRNNPYSLLRCPKRYTLLVKAFQAPMLITGLRGAPPVLNTNTPRPAALDAQVEKELRRLEQILGWKPDAAALQAHNLCEVLRHPSLNYEAYVLHTKEASLVTVGSFDRTDDPNAAQLRQLLAGKTIGVVKLSDNPSFLLVPRPE
ncbi:hypothetical protein HRbin36_02539 [bacterium HR36]|uniref:Hypothetical conserved protein n=1 Tax=uncultured Planctomycetota bacterium TaxID=120965 RepID=H5SCC9_9BACT|nr:hypothetical conserved protein [uncultured Planctomycetota bacterium]GBD37408.1 hypothetical protein HRbin36_02539 [bacterium HR36]